MDELEQERIYNKFNVNLEHRDIDALLSCEDLNKKININIDSNHSFSIKILTLNSDTKYIRIRLDMNDHKSNYVIEHL